METGKGKKSQPGGIPYRQEDIQKLLTSPEGRQLLLLLQSDKSALGKAAAAIQGGDYSKAQQLLQPLMKSKEGSALLEKLGGTGA
ncbi:MAG: hypothetical protein SOV46_08265 [Candidatus Faecousia sp.]|nr:hypothetical protein [Candidatus Faecousia sp.]